MKKTGLLILVFAIIGLILGYLIFGRIAGEYVSLDLIFQESSNVVEKLGRNISGLKEMKQNILISGGAGGLLGLVIALFRKK
jgi:hypothetical protein